MCGSRIGGWDISFGGTVADNASAGAYVLGSEKKTLQEFVPRDVEMSMTVDGEEVSTGNDAACLGDPVNALVWLARQVASESPCGLGAAVFGGDEDLARQVADQLDVRMVGINTGIESAPDLRFGGVKASGVGRELGRFGPDEFAKKRHVRRLSQVSG